MTKAVVPASDRRNGVQRVIAACADSVDGQALTIDPICPHCLAPKVSLTDDYLPDFRTIHVATFRGYSALPQREKMTKIRRIVY